MLALNADWDERLLAEEFRALPFSIDAGNLDVDLQVLGFNDVELVELDKILDQPVEVDEEPRAIEVQDELAVGQGRSSHR